MSLYLDHVELLAGASNPHGEHENRRQGWDAAGRAMAAKHGRLDPDADTYGRHASRDHRDALNAEHRNHQAATT